MFLWWGPDLIQFYNDAYRPSLGQDGKHPTALGQRGVDCWQEIWPTVKPLIDQVLSGGEATWNEDQLIPIYRNGELEDVYWTFSYSPVYDESGEPAGVFVTCTETTEKVIQLHQLAESNDALLFAIEATELGSWDLNPISGEFQANARLKEWFGLIPQEKMNLSLSLQAIIEKDRQRVTDAIQRSLQYKSGGQYDTEYTIVHPASGEERIVKAKGRAWFNEERVAYRFNGTLQDVTSERKAQMEKELAQQITDLATSSAGIGIFRINLLTGQSEYSPVFALLMTGNAETKDLTRERLIQYLHPEDDSLRQTTVQSSFQTGEFSYEPRIVWDDKSVHRIQIKGKTIYDKANQPSAFSGTVRDVTEQRKQAQALEESELFSRSVIDNSPVAKVVFVGEDMVIKTVNQNMLAMLGRDASIIGMTFIEAMPELRDTSLLKRLHHVFTTGETFYQPEEKIELVKYGQPYTGYFNYIYKALWNTAGELYGIIVAATEVTDQVIARQKVEEAEATLRGAIELAALGTWQIDLPTRIMEYSPRLRHWNGIELDEIITVERAYQAIRPEDHERIRAAIFQAILPSSDGVYDVEYTLNAAQAGKERILRAQGLAFFDAQGRAYKISGTVQDVTDQRRVQTALELQVQERTEELESMNEELAATNDDLAVTNEELADTVRDLQRSNENLQQFAYIASHDLQEPLRKIQSFGDILKTQYSQQLGDGADYLQRMQAAASRMSTLIKDLLTFSRISTRQETASSVALNGVILTVLTDLDLTIQETGAMIDVDILPTVQGDPSQLGQLFQNLLSNALKFRRTEVTPVIQMMAHSVAAADLPPLVKPSRTATAYSRIDVRDNGIGFDEKYADRIFQVFQRLHNKSQYAGTGIGLAICEKVAANHGGAISAHSQVGQGATFSVYLPV